MSKQNNTIQIAGVQIHNVNMEESVNRVVQYCKDTSKHHIATPNLDFIYNANKNVDFKRILNSCALNIPDGMPLVLLSKRLGVPLKEKVSGADFFIEVCRVAAINNFTVYLLGAAPGVANQAKIKLEKKFAGLKIVGTLSPSFGFEKNEMESKEIVNEVNEASPDILFVGVGSPKQEFWINANLENLNIKVAVGVGASFDFAAGNLRIPPPLIKKSGFAWLWRLFSEPRRLWKRYLINDLPYFVKLYSRALFSKK